MSNFKVTLTNKKHSFKVFTLVPAVNAETARSIAERNNPGLISLSAVAN